MHVSWFYSSNADRKQKIRNHFREHQYTEAVNVSGDRNKNYLKIWFSFEILSSHIPIFNFAYIFFVLLQLKKEQEIQKQMLWHTFQEKNKQLELQHKLQLEHKYQVCTKHMKTQNYLSLSLTLYPFNLILHARILR